jgi:hypothetical protein
LFMKTSRKARAHFPFYLRPGPNRQILQWLGKHLEQLRGSRSIQKTAKLAAMSVDKIRALERGEFTLSLGRLREMLPVAYRISWSDLLAKCYTEHRAQFDPIGTRPFERDFHYSISVRRNLSGALPPALLVGGNPKSFLWAVPMRHLKAQPMVTEFLELAPARKRIDHGATPANSHDGAVVLHVIHGSVQVHVAVGGEGIGSRILRAGDSIHFISRQQHYVENIESTTSALLLIVSAPCLKN